jgi:hypothetical protein
MQTLAADKKPGRAGRITLRDELAEVLAKHHVAIGVSVPEVVPDATGNLAKCWSEWQDLNLRPPRPERGSGLAEFASAFASELLNTRPYEDV